MAGDLSIIVVSFSGSYRQKKIYDRLPAVYGGTDNALS